MIQIDLEAGTVSETTAGKTTTHDIGSPAALRLITAAYLRSGWDAKYVYSFTWMGRPLIQLPDDMLRLQEVIYDVKPDVIVETGIAHGGSLIFYACLFKAMGQGRVVGVDIEIRPHNRAAIEAHEMFPLITLIEGDSIAPATIKLVRDQIKPGERVLVFLDGCHTKAHVLAELELYGPLVSPGSYIVAMDGIMKDLVGAPRSQPDWADNNPSSAALEFVAAHPEFEIVDLTPAFNEGAIAERCVTYWPNAFIRRKA
jgi:cephalosporin hydroxylase